MIPNYIVVHTAAFQGRNCDAARIDQWHKDRGWNGIGYHFVILNDRHDDKADGDVEKGRPENVTGAHAKGINSQSIGICCVGHGDFEKFTDAQMDSLLELLSELVVKYGLSASRVIGHRELNRLVDEGVIDAQYRTSKSCPGNLVNMDALRESLQEVIDTFDGSEIEAAAEALHFPAEVVTAINTLKENRALFRNAQDELSEFLFHPEIIAATET